MSGHSVRLMTMALLATVGCAQATVVAQTPVSSSPSAVDTLAARCGPPGFGSLREDDITIRIALIGGLQVSAVPLDECVIRMLSPDSYRVLQQRRASRQPAVDSVATRRRLQKYSLWSVMFYATEQGEVRFSPFEFVIRNVGQDFRPIEVIGLTTGFSEYRLTQREQQRAILVFDGQVDLNQPLTAVIQSTTSTTSWQDVMRRVEQERSLVRSRAAAKSPLK
ncbi:MAG: hypothetical protein H7Z40_20345 [Phycisphaerae bacterium]|nr:hypothetical protein [Gemmatimonadaceae bacterium]